MKNKRKISFFIILIAVLMVCSVSICAGSANVSLSDLQVTLSLNGRSVVVRDTSSAEQYNFYSNVTGTTSLDFDYKFPQQDIVSAESEFIGEFFFYPSEWDFDSASIRFVTVDYMDGRSYTFRASDVATNVEFELTSLGLRFCRFSASMFLDDVAYIANVRIELEFLNLRKTDFIFYTARSWFYILFDAPIQPGDEVFNDFSGFGNDAGAVENSENQIKDEISNYQPQVTSLLSDFSSIVGDLTAPLRAVTLLVNDFVSGIPFLQLMLRFALSVGIVAFLLGTGSFVISKVSSGVRSSASQTKRDTYLEKRAANFEFFRNYRGDDYD